MSDRIKPGMPVIVEGRYDRIKLESLIDGIIITTNGFGIYNDREKMSLIRRYAAETGVIILTDSDGAGFQIRNALRSRIPEGKIINIYIPDIFGKEKRKDRPSKEGKLGVEGIDKDILRKAFEDAGVVSCGDQRKKWADKQRLVSDGLSGGDNSSGMRKMLCRGLGLPERLTAKGLIDALNTLCTEEEYNKVLDKIRSESIS